MRNPERPALTLHEAMVHVLRKCEDQTIERVELARIINENGLFWRVNGDPINAAQIGARAIHHPELFELIPPDRQAHIRAKIRLI